MGTINKVVYGNTTLIDLTADTVTADQLHKGLTAHDKSGAIITGTDERDSNTSDATAAAAEILATKTAYVAGSKVTGTMVNRGGVTGVISEKTEEYSIQSGYHDGSGKVGIDATEQAKIIADNIKSGVNILGVVGTYSGESTKGQSKTVTPFTNTDASILPDAGYDYLTEVIVKKIAYVETTNTAGGTTVTIGTVS